MIVNIWEGTFHSTLPFVHGVILVSLPDDISQTYQSIATMRYDGAYRKGETSQFSFGYIGPSAIGKGYQQGLRVVFEGFCIASRQEITFHAEEVSDTTVRGTYVSMSPSDRGTFNLQRSKVSHTVVPAESTAASIAAIGGSSVKGDV
jgi:hypothetical protein